MVAMLLGASAGCGTLPQKSVPDSASPVGIAASTTLGRIAAVSLPTAWPSGFRLLPQAGQAFEAREQLMARAELSIDAQYYFIAGDGAGRDFLGALEAATRRGVHVRLLIDDLHDAEIDLELARLARLPRFEVRLFNPFCCARSSLVTRFAASLFDTSRLERRMHNKLIVVDRSLAIAGGRNIADAYFGRSEVEEFFDIDALMAGDIVSQLGAVFDRYWQSDPVWPAQDVLAAPPAEPFLRRPRPAAATAAPVPAVDLLGQRAVGAELAAGILTLSGGHAYAFADPPSKALKDDEDYLQETSVLTRARETLLTAKSQAIIATPYLIPRARGLAMMAHLHGQGVALRILTNGAAANDSLLAHAAYVRYRHQIVRRGVELFELNARGAGIAGPAAAGVERRGPLARLHAKAFVVDRRTVFIGSTNFDPRSSDKNTELGILVDSAPLAYHMVQIIDAYRRLGSARVGLPGQKQARVQWFADGDSTAPRVLEGEPGAGFLNWIADVLLLPLVPEDLL